MWLEHPILMRLQPLFGTEYRYRFSKRSSKWFTDYKITTAAKSDTNRLVVFGTEEGIIAISVSTGCDGILGGCFQAFIADAPIMDVEWLGPGAVGVAGGMNVYSYDVVKETASCTVSHETSVKCVRRRDENVFFSGGRDGYAYGWDLRSRYVCYTLDHTIGTGRRLFCSIGAMEFSCRNNMVVYTANTPGGIVNMWDLRYLKNGKHSAESHMVSCKSIENLKYCKDNLYAMDSDVSMFMVSQSGSLHKNIYKYPDARNFRADRLYFYEYLDLILCASDGVLLYVDPDSGMGCTSKIEGLEGILPLESGCFLGYDDRGNVSDFATNIMPSIAL